ncbi:hypothetical protein REL07_005435 [Clostridioides difficile]|uniref:hypothetical protein n=2 Tax=Clostridioides difficile TaxID=1496 RepID=UPI001112776D|nr:hypothetical protein [Clostridioides difficile]MBY0106900.1 hypothetical protein [Clostridioides difficile]MBY2131928.1 hypothetical protein [Clostridioides difficile]MBY2475161.1 hypothetical protein [Clostridioides difficile]MBY2657629.1 hypothetical protein [Clostridioides difficile]MCI2310117.1 hypothetical protein [Clostridioides difficile]
MKRYVMHQIKNTLNYVSYKNRKEFIKYLKKVYAAITEKIALGELSLEENRAITSNSIKRLMKHLE